MWDLPRPGLEPVSPALAGRFSTTAPPGKPLYSFNEIPVQVFCPCFTVELSIFYLLTCKVLYIFCRVLWLAYVVQISSLALQLAFGLSLIHFWILLWKQMKWNHASEVSYLWEFRWVNKLSEPQFPIYKMGIMTLTQPISYCCWEEQIRYYIGSSLRIHTVSRSRTVTMVYNYYR